MMTSQKRTRMVGILFLINSATFLSVDHTAEGNVRTGMPELSKLKGTDKMSLAYTLGIALAAALAAAR